VLQDLDVLVEPAAAAGEDVDLDGESLLVRQFLDSEILGQLLRLLGVGNLGLLGGTDRRVDGYAGRVLEVDEPLVRLIVASFSALLGGFIRTRTTERVASGVLPLVVCALPRWWKSSCGVGFVTTTRVFFFTDAVPCGVDLGPRAMAATGCTLEGLREDVETLAALWSPLEPANVHRLGGDLRHNEIAGVIAVADRLAAESLLEGRVVERVDPCDAGLLESPLVGCQNQDPSCATCRFACGTELTRPTGTRPPGAP
jgi:hypothetical protein